MTEGRGSLGLVQATALYVAAVLGTGVLVLPAIAAETAGPASLVAWAALIALSVPMSLTYAAMSLQRPDAAGFSDAIGARAPPGAAGVARSARRAVCRVAPSPRSRSSAAPRSSSPT